MQIISILSPPPPIVKSCMSLETGLMIGAALFGPSLMKAIGITPDTKAPNLVVEQPPKPASAIAPEGARDQERKRIAAAGGRSDTIKTGAKGLGELGQQNKEQKTLLGY